MKENKGFQFCVGLLVIVLTYKLYASGWISDVWGAKDPDAVEIRRYQADADLQNAEPWVQQLYHASKGYQPCAVVSLGMILAH